MNTIIKDCGEIWNRLFDHRPFLSGEIKFFVDEFEEKRKDREVTQLFEILERVTEIRDTQIDKVKTLTANNLPALQKNLDSALAACDQILDNQDKYDCDTLLEAKREFRKAEWEAFVVDMEAKYKKVDETFAEKEKELNDFYTDLERKLHITN